MFVIFLISLHMIGRVSANETVFSLRPICTIITMKRFKRYFRCIVLLMFLLTALGTRAQRSAEFVEMSMDSVEISLLTCQPRQNVYSLYGHTAIRYEDKASGIDMAVNYGMFSFSEPFFVLRFVFGLTDYTMDIEPFADFYAQYSHYGCGVRQQVLNLTAGEKAAIGRAIDVNYQPENRVYRYNYFYDNCTTRARDILVGHLQGRVVYDTAGMARPSYREMTHAYNAGHPWARFGNDMLLGVKADAPTNNVQQQFLPDNLRKDFDKAVIVDSDGVRRPLVSRSFWVIPPAAQVAESEFPLTPMQCAVLLLVMVAGCTLYECLRRKNFWVLDALLMLAGGLCGLILLAMVFSEHPTVSLNFQILLLCPLSLVMLYPTVKALRQHRIHWWMYVHGALIAGYFVLGFWQTYAEGMDIVALSLLIRYICKAWQCSPTNKNKQLR